MKTDYLGIDYGMGRLNVDHETGIHYGVISQNEVGEAWFIESEAVYSGPFCPKCWNKAEEFETKEYQQNGGAYFSVDIPEEMEGWERAEGESEDYYCEQCEYIFGSESAFSEDPDYFKYEGEGYYCQQGSDDTDIFILKSPYFTYCQYCSPCAPGAGYLMNYMDKDKGIKAYCFGPDWFEGGKAPYPVYSVETGELIQDVEME